jgi:RNA polymerase sigma factor (sigma-70 family)
MESDPEIGGRHERFPVTRHSVVQAARSESEEVRRRALETLAESYWSPVYTYLRLRWRASNEDAQDLAQGFFARALEKGLFERYDPARARLRTYLRVTLDGFVANQRKADGRLKRGGGAEVVPLEFETAEGEIVTREIPDGVDPDRLFHREWVRAIFDRAVGELRAHCEATERGIQFAIFERYDLEALDARPSVTYDELAKSFGLPVTQVTNYLAWARREFRRCVLERLRESTGGEEEFHAEAREILGVDPL